MNESMNKMVFIESINIVQWDSENYGKVRRLGQSSYDFKNKRQQLCSVHRPI